jgi:hypothetical protein
MIYGRPRGPCQQQPICPSPHRLPPRHGPGFRPASRHLLRSRGAETKYHPQDVLGTADGIETIGLFTYTKQHFFDVPYGKLVSYGISWCRTALPKACCVGWQKIRNISIFCRPTWHALGKRFLVVSYNTLCRMSKSVVSCKYHLYLCSWHFSWRRDFKKLKCDYILNSCPESLASDTLV